MAGTDPKRASRLLRDLVPVWVAAAGLVAVLLYSQDRVGRESLPRDILGSFFALLGACGTMVLLARWRQPAKAAWSRVFGRLNRVFRIPAAVTQRTLPAIAVLISIALLSFWFRDMAFSFDHAEHCFQAFHFWTEMLGRGRLHGWSHVLAFGYPYGELTPPGPEIWVALFRVLTLGLLSWAHTYAVAFAGMLTFATVAMYLFTKRFFGATAGIIAALLWVLDPGGWFQGGWFWLVWLGVWPVTLALSFSLLSLIKLADLLSSDPARRRHGDLLWGAFWIMASLITHQLPLVLYAVALPALLLAEMLKRERLPDGATVRFAATTVLGLGLAAFYLVPMLGRNDLSLDLGQHGYSLEELGHRLTEMRVFDGVWSVIIVLALAGGIVAIRSGSAPGVSFVVCGAIFLLLCSDILVSVLHTERLLKGILKIESQRMLLLAKLFWFPLAAHAGANLFRRRLVASAAVRPSPAPMRRFVCFLVVSALAAPLLRPVALYVYRTQVAKDIQVRTTTPLGKDVLSFFAWSRAEREATPDFYRIGYVMTDMHDHIFAIAPVFNGTPLYRAGFTSGQQFRSSPMTAEPELFETLSVKYVVADHDLGGPSFALDRMFGQLRVYRFTGYRPHHPFTLLGQGRVDLVRFDPERVHLRLQGIAPGTRLKLHVARYPRWEATLNGRSLAISPATVYGMEYPFLMEVPAGDGDLVFRYVYRASDSVGLALSLMAWAFFGLVATRRIDNFRRLRWTPSLLSFFRRAAPAARWISLVGVAILFGFAVWKLASPARLSPDSAFSIPSSGAELSLAGIRCETLEPARWQCGPHEIRAAAVSGEYGTHFCVTAPAVGPLVLSANTKLGRFLEATYDPVVEAPGRIRISADGDTLGEMSTRERNKGLQFLQLDTRSRASSTVRLQVEIQGAPVNCFDLKIVR